MDVAEGAPAGDELGVPHGDRVAEVQAALEGDDERPVFDALEHDGADLHTPGKPLRDAIQEPGLRLRSEVVAREKTEHRGATPQALRREPAAPIGELVLELEGS